MTLRQNQSHSFFVFALDIHQDGLLGAYIDINNIENILNTNCEFIYQWDFCFYCNRNISKIIEYNIMNIDYYVIHLERGNDRLINIENMRKKLKENIEIFNAIDGNLLEPSIIIQKLFENNDFNYRKGIIGCALSHLELWNNLVNDSNYDFSLFRHEVQGG